MSSKLITLQREENKLNEELRSLGDQSNLSKDEFLTRFNQLSKDKDVVRSKIRIESEREEEEQRAANEEGLRRERGHASEKRMNSEEMFSTAMQGIVEGRSNSALVIPMGLEKRTMTSATAAPIIKTGLYEETIFAPLAGSALEKMGVEMINIDNENTKVAKVNFTGMGDINPYTEAENVGISTLTLTGMDVNLTNRGVIVKVKNNLLRGTIELRTEEILRKAVADKLQQELLYELLVGKANGFGGLDSFAGIQTVDAANVKLSTWEKFISAYTKVLDYNGETSNIAALIPPVVFEQVQGFKDTTGQFLMPPPGIKDMAMIPCSIIKKDYGVGTNRTRVYLGNFSGVKVFMAGMYELKSEHRYLEEDVTAFRVVVRAQMQVHIPEHIVRIENIAL
ncbi:MAG TPA: phage major capsid protein [Haliscomenobacter sp.]|uniref:phage major capsid protein n=1 Tax=Haliscomenobacter sp. TaxID=2717303 RepID=UPI002CBE217C|nr:phage major capsid protein [Haliscomenobacter sp.]HOY20341.1 phage major capsid protein [Haliscomenobacter sp.]